MGISVGVKLVTVVAVTTGLIPIVIIVAAAVVTVLVAVALNVVLVVAAESSSGTSEVSSDSEPIIRLRAAA